MTQDNNNQTGGVKKNPFIFAFDFDNTLTYKHSKGRYNTEPFNKDVDDNTFAEIFSSNNDLETAKINLYNFFYNLNEGKKHLQCIYYINSRGIRSKILKFLQSVDSYIKKGNLFKNYKIKNNKYTFRYLFDNYKNIYGASGDENITPYNSLTDSDEKNERVINGEIDKIGSSEWPYYKFKYLVHFKEINNIEIPYNNIYFFDDTKENIDFVQKKNLGINAILIEHNLKNVNNKIGILIEKIEYRVSLAGTLKQYMKTIHNPTDAQVIITQRNDNARREMEQIKQNKQSNSSKRSNWKPKGINTLNARKPKEGRNKRRTRKAVPLQEKTRNTINQVPLPKRAIYFNISSLKKEYKRITQQP